MDNLWKYEIAKFVHSTIYNRNPNSFHNYFLKSTEHLNRAARQSLHNLEPISGRVDRASETGDVASIPGRV